MQMKNYDSSTQIKENSKQINELTVIASRDEETLESSFDVMAGAKNTITHSVKNAEVIKDINNELVKSINVINELSIGNGKDINNIMNLSSSLYKMAESLNQKLNEFKT